MSILPAIPSAAVMIVRDVDGSPEVLLVRRNTKIAFHGGSWVFPGGKVDAADQLLDNDPDELQLARRAAAREVSEEAGVAVDALSLTTFGHWTTPENQPKRFATWFFATQVSAETNVEIDGSEIVDHRWLTVEDALELRASNEFTLPPPTFVSLKKLQRFSDSRTFLQHLGDTGAERFMPRVVDLDNGRCSLYQEDAGYDALDLALGGARHRLYMLESGWEYIREF